MHLQTSTGCAQPKRKAALETLSYSHKGMILPAQILEFDITERDFHGRETLAELPGDEALVGHFGEIAVNGGRAVELDRDVLADALEGVVVEVGRLDDLSHDLLHGQFQPVARVALVIEAAPEGLADIPLRAGDGVFFGVNEPAAELAPAVAFPVLEPELEGQLEVLEPLLAAQERIEFQPLGRPLPTMIPSRTLQYSVSPSQPSKFLPLKNASDPSSWRGAILRNPTPTRRNMGFSRSPRDRR